MANDILAGIVSSVIHHVVAPLIRPTSQHIFNLRVAPGIDFVRISFQTVQPTIPVITCEASDGSMTFAFPIFGGMRTKHESILGESTPLQQDVNHLLRIVAAGRDSQGHQIEKIATGNFTTGSRHATIKFDSIKVRNDSDSGGNGELTLFFTGGDADNGVLMGGPLVWPYMDINDDDPPAVLNLEFQIQKAPRRLWAAVSAYDSDFAPFPNVDDVNKIGPVFSFNGEGSEGWSSDAYDYANVTRVVDIADMIALTEFPIELATRDFALAYTVNGRIRVDPFVPAAIESRPPGRALTSSLRSTLPSSARHNSHRNRAAVAAVAGTKADTVTSWDWARTARSTTSGSRHGSRRPTASAPRRVPFWEQPAPETPLNKGCDLHHTTRSKILDTESNSVPSIIGGPQ